MVESIQKVGKVERRNAEYKALFPRGSQVWRDRFKKEFGTVFNYTGWPNKVFDTIVVEKVNGIDDKSNAASWPIKKVVLKQKQLL